MSIVNFSSLSNTTKLEINAYYKVGYQNLETYYLSWYLPLTLIVGLIGNIGCLIFIIMSKLFPRNVLIWMICIAVGDILILSLDCTRMLIKIWLRFDIRDYNDFMCKIHNFLSNYFFYWSSYMQACMSIQRLVLMLYPLRARMLFTTKLVLAVCCVFTGILIFPNLPYLICWRISVHKTRLDCEPSHESLYSIITVLDMIIWGFIPLLTMTTSTIGISISVFKASSERRELSRPTKSLLNNPGEDGKKPHSNPQANLQNDDAWHVTRLLISMNLLYLISAYPLLIYQIYLNAGGNKVGRTIPQQLHKTIYYSLRSICYISSSWNWVFYFLGGRKLRQRILRIIREQLCKCFGAKTPNSQMKGSHRFTNNNSLDNSSLPNNDKKRNSDQTSTKLLNVSNMSTNL